MTETDKPTTKAQIEKLPVLKAEVDTKHANKYPDGKTLKHTIVISEDNPTTDGSFYQKKPVARSGWFLLYIE